MATPHSITTCPRCGYDLSASQRDGEVRGTCSECGLVFSWEELASGALHSPRFSYEHGRPLNLFRFLGSCAAACSGSFLWSRLRMVHRIVPGRLVLFATILLFVSYSTIFGITLWASANERILGWMPRSERAAMAAWRFGSRPYPQPSRGGFYTNLSGWPVTTEDLPELLGWPVAGQGSIEFRMPLTLYGVLRLQGGLLTILLVPAGCPCVLLMLRQTRRQFRLRKQHVLRGGCLSVPSVLVCLLLSMVLEAAMQLAGIASYWDDNRYRLALATLFVCIMLPLAWWHAFAARYLRAPHALGIACAGVVLGGLLAVLAGVMSHANWLYHWLA